MGSISGEELPRWEKLQGTGAPEEKIFVSVRLRPLNAKEIARNDVSDWECINDNTVIYRNGLSERSMFPTAHTFDRVFRCDCSTRQVYEEAAKEVALSVVSGINSSIFAYGQTSSGKTYTMGGITEYTVADIYDYIKRHEERAFVLKFSAMEIYNEAVRDLLSADANPLRLLDDPEVNVVLDRGTIVEKITEETLRDWKHLRELLSTCEAQRQTADTFLNETSSRSHQILRLTIESSAREFLGKDKSSTLSASVNFVDLAGSERASQALSAGTRLKEGCHINRSLLTLGTVIRKLSKGRNGHIPYRDSKLTRILQPSLGGNARTAIICTISPARSHVEQSRNTLLFASCAKEVATNAQVNVVMSDKALVKHLQKELARLETQLRGPEQASATSGSLALLREKDLRIAKMEKEIRELIKQRDLAQSRLEDLLRVVGVDQASKIWLRFDNHSKFQAHNEWEDVKSVSESSVVDDPHYSIDVTRINTDWYSDSNSVNNYPQLPEIPEDHYLSDGTSPRLSINSPNFIRRDPCQGWEEIAEETVEDSEDICKEVRCIEMEESNRVRNIEPKALSPQENEGILDSTVTGNGDATDQLLILSRKKGDSDLKHMNDFMYGALEQKLHDVQKTVDCLVNPSLDEPSPWLPGDMSSSRRLQLTRSRSCRAALMISSSTSYFEREDQSENTPPSRFERDFSGRPEVFHWKFSTLNYGDDVARSSSKDFQTSEGNASIGDPKAQNAKTSGEEDITSVHTFVTGLKEMVNLQYEKQLLDGQETESKPNESAKTVKDVGLDPMKDPLESPPSWRLEFERMKEEIIELWNACYVSLVHRTYFLLLFKGDPADSIYMEVELRRLSFLKDTFSRGHLGRHAMEDGRTLTPASSMRALRRERVMLCKQMQKKFSEKEREQLYVKWNIQLDSKRRRLQLVHRLWTDTKDMNLIVESATIVAKLVGFLETGQALKEMFGLSFTPPRSNRSYSWKQSMSFSSRNHM
ncbi:kinesin-like protein KIN-7E isoform X2 [Telopea speciosissima]|uniref:kinesin-like protein KIN-7E isoform X2 n=1 Tax=Telopea speciosissima TaxID=54955 RepID=UPI001CC7F169|nr:kinesin-like protein KIN-7E isoform X2 [Telopea speciosissima]